MIKTDRLTLDALSEKDKGALIVMFKDVKVKNTYMVPDLNGEEDEKCLFNTLKRLSHSEGRIVYGVYLDGELIGLINDTGIDNGTVEFGWAISPSHHNKGYATEAVSALIKRLFADGYTEILAGAFEENAASIRVMEKCGMTRTEKKETIEYRGLLRRCVYYSVKC